MTGGWLCFAEAVIVLNKQVPGENIEFWQDQSGRKHSEVLAIFDAAIAATERGEHSA